MAKAKETKPTVKNLIPQNKRTKDEQSKIARMGGIASGEARREKKRISQIYADFLSDEFDIEIDDIKNRLTGEKLLNETIKRVMIRGDAASVSMLKEIREATEGSQINLSGSVTIIDDVK